MQFLLCVLEINDDIDHLVRFEQIRDINDTISSFNQESIFTLVKFEEFPFELRKGLFSSKLTQNYMDEYFNYYEKLFSTQIQNYNEEIQNATKNIAFYDKFIIKDKDKKEDKKSGDADAAKKEGASQDEKGGANGPINGASGNQAQKGQIPENDEDKDEDEERQDFQDSLTQDPKQKEQANKFEM